MASLNKIMIIGNLGKDPEMRITQAGLQIANLSVACTEKYKDKQGNQQEYTEWVNVSVFGKLAEICEKYLTKGSTVYIEGKIRTEKYQKDGQDRFITKVIADTMQMLGGKKQDKTTSTEYQNKEADATIQKSDDDLPF
jgi:single-strand DNA-binding protein